MKQIFKLLEQANTNEGLLFGKNYLFLIFPHNGYHC
jgi:hypothetical protein